MGVSDAIHMPRLAMLSPAIQRGLTCIDGSASASGIACSDSVDWSVMAPPRTRRARCRWSRAVDPDHAALGMIVAVRDPSARFRLGARQAARLSWATVAAKISYRNLGLLCR